MGCDIHAFVEVKVDNEWLHYAEARINGNYNLFSRMADVRNDNSITPISSPRGLPKDISKMVSLHRNRWGKDGHSDSWLSYDEIYDLYLWSKSDSLIPLNLDIEHTLFGVYLFRNSLNGWKDYPEDYPEFVQDVRLVFWFDN